MISRKTFFVTKSNFFTSIWVIKFSISQFYITYVSFCLRCSFETRLSDSVNYKTGSYANLADVTGNFVRWGEIVTHDHLSIEKKVQTHFVQMTESDKECTSLARALCKQSEK